MDQISFRIKPVPPFRLDLTVWALRRRAENIVDRWDGSSYRRVLALADNSVEVEVTQTGPPEKAILQVTVTGNRLLPNTKPVLKNVLEDMFGLRRDLSDFYIFADSHKKLRGLAQRFRGLKPPCFPTLFEALTAGIACQQLSLTVGIILLNRLAQRYGVSFPGKKERVHSFPLPGKLEKSDMNTLRKLGFSRQKGRYLMELSRLVSQEKVNLKGLTALSDEAALEQLYQIPGVGRWTGEYALLRGLGRIHILPGDDVGARNKLQRLLNLTEPLDYEGVRRIRERWKPYGGFIYFHFLLDGLSEEGYL